MSQDDEIKGEAENGIPSRAQAKRQGWDSGSGKRAANLRKPQTKVQGYQPLGYLIGGRPIRFG